MSKILQQLVMGELQQMAKVSEDKADRYQRYIDKTFNKTASLMAHACRSQANYICLCLNIFLILLLCNFKPTLPQARQLRLVLEILLLRHT